MSEIIQTKLVRLPLWRACLEEMLENGVTHGKRYPVSFFEERLRAKRDTVQYSGQLSKIRQALEHYGLHLSGRGPDTDSGEQVIIPPEENMDQGTNFEQSANKLMRRAVTLCATTDMALLNDEQARKHNAKLARFQTKMALMQKPLSTLEELEKLRMKHGRRNRLVNSPDSESLQKP